MLPALAAIANELGAARPNDAQFVITSLFLGLGAGQMLFGPLSDRIGRKPAIYTGLALFMTGCLASLFASTFEAMIAGRLLQGVGVAAPHVVSMALVRDQYEGRLMARLMSLALAVFILVPTIAPAARAAHPVARRLAHDLCHVPCHRRSRARLARAASAGDPPRQAPAPLLASCDCAGRGRGGEDSRFTRLHARLRLRVRPPSSRT